MVEVKAKVGILSGDQIEKIHQSYYKDWFEMTDRIIFE